MVSVELIAKLSSLSLHALGLQSHSHRGFSPVILYADDTASIELVMACNSCRDFTRGALRKL